MKNNVKEENVKMKCYIVHFRADGVKYSCRVLAYSAEDAVKTVAAIGGDTYTVARVKEI